MKFWSVVLLLALALTGVNADAKRLSGGKSIGRQSGNVTQREAAPAAPAPNTAAAPARPAPATAAPAPAPRRPWGAMLGGLAAGLGLAWLAHSLGLGEAFGQFLLIGLLVLAGMAVLGLLLRRRQPPAADPGYAWQGAGEAVTTPRSYRPENVGNDASARPFERTQLGFDPAPARAGTGVVIGSALAGGTQNWSIPADFDAQGFVQAAKTNFVALQAAWDRADLGALRAMMTDDMMAEIRQQLAERESGNAGAANQTEVVMLEAQLLGIEDLDTEYLASIEFSGLIREQPSAGPSPFREVWNMSKPRDGSRGWLVAGVQALQ